RYWSGIWGGFAITAILYFLLIKGAKGSTLVTPEMLAFIKDHTTRILLVSFVGWTILFQILILFTKINIWKITVLAGTFALAMAFAGNDLVNFIGVPLAGFESFKTFIVSGSTDAGGFLMGALEKPVDTPLFFLITAGIIMVLTLRFSKKAKFVTATSVDLSRQDEGSERFDSTSLARFIVRRSVEVSHGIARITPRVITRFIEKRFDAEHAPQHMEEKPAFDLVRASVTLVVASILIALGTSFRLPLSTTYVTFMVAMGSSLADGAWGRDSAVYRISGVLTVVGGWFFTAFIAFLASFLIASFIFFGKMPAILILIGLALYILLRTHAFHKKRTEKVEEAGADITTSSNAVLRLCNDEVKNTVLRVSKILYLTYFNFFKEKHNELKKLRKEARHLVKEIKEIREDIPNTLKKFDETDLVSGHHYVQVVDYMKETCNSLYHVVQPAFNHLDNNHSFDKEQTARMRDFNDQVSEFFNFVINLLKNRSFDRLDELVHRRDEMINLANDILLSRIKILKKTRKGVKVSVTYMEMLSETKNLLLDVVQLVKANVKLVESTIPGDEKAEEPVLVETKS
ncbi:MAG: phosphate permease, partial [Bacteroidota bacterium]